MPEERRKIINMITLCLTLSLLREKMKIALFPPLLPLHFDWLSCFFHPRRSSIPFPSLFSTHFVTVRRFEKDSLFSSLCTITSCLCDWRKLTRVRPYAPSIRKREKSTVIANYDRKGGSLTTYLLLAWLSLKLLKRAAANRVNKKYFFLRPFFSTAD